MKNILLPFLRFFSISAFVKQIRIKNTKSKSLKIFGLRFEIWKVIQGYRLSVDTKTTRYIFKPFWYTGKCKVADLV